MAAPALDQAEAPAPIQRRILGKVVEADDNSIRIGSLFYKLTKTHPYNGPALPTLLGREVFVTYSPWSSPDGTKNYRYIDLITLGDDQAEPQEPAAAEPSPRESIAELAAKYPPAGQAQSREYLMARMSALKAAVHLGAQTGATSEDCLAVAERYLAWLYQA